MKFETNPILSTVPERAARHDESEVQVTIEPDDFDHQIAEQSKTRFSMIGLEAGDITESKLVFYYTGLTIEDVRSDEELDYFGFDFHVLLSREEVRKLQAVLERTTTETGDFMGYGTDVPLGLARKVYVSFTDIGFYATKGTGPYDFAIGLDWDAQQKLLERIDEQLEANMNSIHAWAQREYDDVKRDREHYRQLQEEYEQSRTLERGFFACPATDCDRAAPDWTGFLDEGHWVDDDGNEIADEDVDKFFTAMHPMRPDGQMVECPDCGHSAGTGRFHRAWKELHDQVTLPEPSYIPEQPPTRHEY